MVSGLELGKRLARRREEFGISAQTVAEWAELPLERVQSIERGDGLPPWELRDLSHALAISPGAILQGTERSLKRSVARFRAAIAPEPSRPVDLRLLAVGAEVGRILGELVNSTPLRPKISDLRQPLGISDDQPLWEQGYRLGESAHFNLAVTSSPILDLEIALASIGVHVGKAPFDSEELDAASLWEAGSVPVILLNLTSPRVQYLLSRRAILAHELCHLLHDSGESDLTTEVSRGERADEIEQRARGFAPAFIAPRNAVRAWSKTCAWVKVASEESAARARVNDLARHWGFSIEGAAWHAKNCRLISARMAEELSRENPARERPWMFEFEAGRGADAVILPSTHNDILDSVSPLWSGLGVQIVASAYHAGVISAGRAKEILSWR